MIIAINYADNNFREAQILNTRTAYKKGKVDNVIEYSPKDIDKKFFEENKEVLLQKRGGGFWLWKPYIILKTINRMNEGDYLIYCDSGAAYINNVKYLIEDLNKSKQDIMVFDLPLIEKQWTKAKTFEYLNCNNEKYKESNQILATYMIIKVSKISKAFIELYLKCCLNKEILIDNIDNENEYFIDHRHDQSIFSLLCKKNNIVPFRDPSQYGIRPWEYMGNGRLYNKKIYKNSNYPQILVSFRKDNGKIYLIKDRVKYLMTKLSLLNEKQYKIKNNIK